MNGTIDGECDYCGAEDALNEYRESGGQRVSICDGCLQREGVAQDYDEEYDDDED